LFMNNFHKAIYYIIMFWHNFWLDAILIYLLIGCFGILYAFFEAERCLLNKKYYLTSGESIFIVFLWPIFWIGSWIIKRKNNDR